MNYLNIQQTFILNYQENINYLEVLMHKYLIIKFSH